MSEIWRLSASQVAASIRQRKLSATEAAQAALARLDAVNPQLNAVVDWRPDEVLQRAGAIDAALARGEDPGPLAGVPVTVKINIDQAGFATSNGLNLQKDLIAATSSPVVDNLLKAGAVIVGRTNTPAFSYRWFTGNQLHGTTLNPRDATLTPGGSSGGAASSVAAGIGHLAHGTDIAGSIRYPAYACGVHGLRPSLGRVAAWNAALPERSIGGQVMAMSGPIARTVHDLRLGLAAMAAPDARDPWWCPAPLVGPDAPRTVALCLRPDGLDTQPEIVSALRDAADRLRDAGWTVDEVDALPPIRDALDSQVVLWMGDGYEAMVRAAEREGDRGAITALAGQAGLAQGITAAQLSAALVKRATITRLWQMFLERYPVVLLPVCAELPFAADLDLQGPVAYARVWQAQLTMIGLPLTGLPALTVSTGMVGKSPVGVQLVAGRFREDLCLAAGEAIEARGVPPMPIDPVAA
ncbi:amidase family protein [Variovorax sp. J22G21]|uniref:amidase family protein n=1 Tax=Variovorax fucosicus TaxID=3053517 RepID=UPI0025789D97|nr:MULTISPECIES: amidase family protein [unclassified Variovorax]MDM0041135.1 amidase family protein [Variovorax sp. J22R193]MDM0060192.1 amidase family protein [Variovorax sp. J22G21]